MTNYEHYKKEVDKIFESENSVALSENTRKPIPCECTDCEQCAFYYDPNEVSCAVCSEKWLISEYKDKEN